MNLMNAQDKMRSHLVELFSIIDEDRSGFISMDELESVLSERQNQAYLQSFDIDARDAWTLVKLLDTDNSGTVELEEFVTGCMALKGDAKAVHVALMAYDQRITLQMLEQFMDKVDEQLGLLLTASGPASDSAPKVADTLIRA